MTKSAMREIPLDHVIAGEACPLYSDTIGDCYEMAKCNWAEERCRYFRGVRFSKGAFVVECEIDGGEEKEASQ